MCPSANVKVGLTKFFYKMKISQKSFICNSTNDELLTLISNSIF